MDVAPSERTPRDRPSPPTARRYAATYALGEDTRHREAATMMRRWCGAIMMALSARMAGAQASDPFASAVQALLAETGDRPAEQAALARIYPPSDTRPLWSGGDGRPTAQASA